MSIFKVNKQTLKKLANLLEIGDVGLYKVMDGGYGISLKFYDGSYSISHPGDSIEEAIREMHDDDWLVQAAMRHPEYNKVAYLKYIDSLSEVQDE